MCVMVSYSLSQSVCFVCVLVLLDCFRASSACSLVLLFSWVGFMDLVGMSWVGWSIGWLVGGWFLCWSVGPFVGLLVGLCVGWSAPNLV